MEIKQMLLTKNRYSRPGTAVPKINGAVVHYVGNPGSTAEGNRGYFESLKAGKKDAKGNFIYASSNYIVGLVGEVIQCVPENEIAYCSNNRNKDTVSVECCHPLADGKFSGATYKSLVELLADICTRHKLNPLKDIIRHYDVTGKACPIYYVNNAFAWERLKKDVQVITLGGRLLDEDYINVKYNGLATEIKAEMKYGSFMTTMAELSRVTGSMDVPVRGILEALGYAVDWNAGTQTIIINSKSA